MAYSTTTQVKTVTGWIGGSSSPYKDISDAEITNLITFADTYIDSRGLSDDRSATELALLSVYATAAMGAARLERNVASYGGSAGSVNLTFKSPSDYWEIFEKVASGKLDADSMFKKVYY